MSEQTEHEGLPPLPDVDLLWASNKAREYADTEILLGYRPYERNSMRASFHWARAFRREFDALTRPQPRPQWGDASAL